MEDNFLDKLKKAMMGQQAPIEIPMAPEQAPEVLEEAQVAAETAQVNEQAKSPNLMTKPELAQAEMQKEADLTVPGQLQERAVASQIETPAQQMSKPSVDDFDAQARLRQNIEKYEKMINAPKEEVKWQDKLQDGFAGLHNILNYGSGSLQKNLATDNYAKQQASKSQGKQTKLGNLQKLQGLYNDYAKSQEKGDRISALDRAKLDQGERSLALKEKLAMLAAKTKGKTATKKNSKLEDEREKAIAK